MTNKRKGRLIFDKARKLLYNVDEVDQKMYGIILTKIRNGGKAVRNNAVRLSQ